MRDHAARVDQRDQVRELVGLLQVLRGEQHGRAAADEPADRRPDLAAPARVQAGGGLVEEEHRRREDQAGREVQPPPHAARVLPDGLPSRVGEPEPLEQLGRPARRAAGAEVVEAAEQLQVLAAREHLVDGGVLAHEPDARPHGGALAGHVAARHLGPPAVRAQERREDAHGGRLARPVGPEQPAHGAGRHGEVEPVERAHVAVALAQPLRLDGEGHH